jgi:hypothetical protein
MKENSGQTPPTQPLPQTSQQQPVFQKPTAKVRAQTYLLLIVLTFVCVYAVAWFGYRSNAHVQGTYTMDLGLKFHLLDEQIMEYKKQHGANPESMYQLFSVLFPDEVLDNTSKKIPEIFDFMVMDPWGKPIEYSRVDENTYTLKSFGIDGKPGGVGVYADIVMGDQPGLGTMPTFEQFLFTIEYSSTFFKTSIILSFIFLLGIQLQFSRKSTSMSRQRFVFNFLILVPCCIFVVSLLVVGHLIPSMHAH